jgi:hypothetical protein
MAKITTPLLSGTVAGATSADGSASFLSFYDLLVAGHPLGLEAPDLAYLDDPAFARLRNASPASHLIVKTFGDLLCHAQKRRQQKKRANGGRREPRGSRLDLAQLRDLSGWLDQQMTSEVCNVLLERLMQAARLAVLMQRSYVRQEGRWLEQQRALALVLARIQDCCTRLSRPRGGWFPVICLKWLLAVLWERLFGQRVPPHLQERLSYQLDDVQRGLAGSLLVPEALQGDTPPMPFVETVLMFLEQRQSIALVLGTGPDTEARAAGPMRG